MKKIKLLIIIVICLFAVNVKAEVDPPSVVQHEVMVTNKEGAVCYENDKKTDKVIPYGKILIVITDINGKYIDVYNEKEDTSCLVKYVDVSAKTQEFSLTNKEVNKITSVNAIVLAKGGLNLRRGPSVTYSKRLTVPQYSVVNLTHRAGTFWYYTTYNGTSGWVTAMSNYLGRDGKEVLYSYKSIEIHDPNTEKVIGRIPENTEITDYVIIDSDYQSNAGYYVVYNGVKGIIHDVYYKIDTPGKIKLIKDHDIIYNNEKVKKLTANQELEYTMVEAGNPLAFYVPSKQGTIYFADEDDFEYITRAKVSIKNKGYIGEGLYGEEKTKEPVPIKVEDDTKEPVIEKNNKSSIKDILIIVLLAGILLSLTALVIIKIMNNKKKAVVKEKEIVKRTPYEVSEEEIERARAIVAKELKKEEQEDKEV